ncbi:metallophosphoesterase family protein [Sphingomonas xinjiangensis]|uniref:Calcineurin-like phosphoesterase family protein n=1 Tax=Sphingomonas xinjiangensis TaxID=643568 RepID=A0A840YHA4_9SPHN|nr:metallophosphoesterase family protein [Sphingomonas xinjiangensis]MBB5712274.1 calcineurin-like phosphoesterase family protein [Sphingomonas xinjiangensis]
MAVFFTADTHFGDHRTINIWKRDFADTAQMDALMIARWNAAVAIGDEVWHLGDVARKASDVPALLDQLNGTKHLIRGNNDPDAVLKAGGWASVGDYRELELDGRRLVLCHYPFRSWNGQHKGAINLHGHSHGRLKQMPRQFDVGVDVHGFAPVQLTALLGS